MITYERLKPEQITEADVADINALLLQLTDAPQPLDRDRAIEIAQKSLWIAARNEEGRIKGINTLTISHIPTGRVGHLDDVVVDKSLRGRGAGEELVKRLIDLARSEALVDQIDLTCRPSRVAANNLYRKLGFQQRETNCYFMKL